MKITAFIDNDRLVGANDERELDTLEDLGIDDDYWNEMKEWEKKSAIKKFVFDDGWIHVRFTEEKP